MTNDQKMTVEIERLRKELDSLQNEFDKVVNCKAWEIESWCCDCEKWGMKEQVETELIRLKKELSFYMAALEKAEERWEKLKRKIEANCYELQIRENEFLDKFIYETGLNEIIKKLEEE